ncbi:MAG: hypothetical protein ABSA47_19780 [Verrucomicrobiota bacterium]
MKTLISLVLSCASVLGADTSIRVATTFTTNASGSVSTKDVFTRNGQTNLVRNTSTTSGVVQIQMHRFYYDGLLVGEFVAMPESSGSTAEAGSPYSIGFAFGPNKEVKSAVIGTKDGVVLDAFMATNGAFYPADISLIGKANDIGGDVIKLFAPAHVTNAPPGEFEHEVEQLIEKHKDK